MRQVTILEVSPRDGLQNESVVFSTAQKLELIGRAVAAGARRIEVASFVRPGKVPQMADAEAVVAGLPDIRGVQYIGLVLNKRGYLRALATRDGNRRGIDQVGFVAIATDSFGLSGLDETLQRLYFPSPWHFAALLNVSTEQGRVIRCYQPDADGILAECAFDVVVEG